MANYTQLSDYCNFNFVSVEDSPLMNPTSNIIIVSSACTILIVGILINGRIYKILSNHTDAAAVDKILKLNTIISLAMHSVILTFYIAASFLYPMSDYIGHVGCFLCVQVLDVFARFYNFMFPVAIALLRYLFVVKSLWVKAVGMKNVVNRIIAFSLFAPFILTIFIQFPIFDGIHGPFNRCIGRFETVFSPLDADPLTPGLRGGLNQCIRTREWAWEPNISNCEFIFRFLLLCGCYVTTRILRIVLFSVPEIVLYSLTFGHILKHTNDTAASGILRPDVIKKRRQRNTLNLIMTCWAWLAQFSTNVIYMVVMYIFFGKDRFGQTFLAVLTVFLNFNVRPLFYVIVADEDFKSAIMNKDFKRIVILFLDC